MSIAVLTQVFTEARRLMIAGSVVAPGDFRLKKLIPPLEQAGKQAPVFAKVGEAAKAVVEGTEDTAAVSLLELTSLVNAVLYTQGETGLQGKIEPIDSIELGDGLSQTSARVLKPLLEALSSTGSGRLDLIREAEQRGQFRDLRLVKPAIAAIDDPYPEIAELLIEKVLPMYGQAILPDLKGKYDQKGNKGHARRLRLMNKLDPAGTRSLVKEALDNGSKEVKVAAISCLGSDPDDLQYLIDQVKAKAKDVREAAYEGLANLDHADVIPIFEKGLQSKDYSAVANAIENGKNSKIVSIMIQAIDAGIIETQSLKDKKKIGQIIDRIQVFISSLPTKQNPLVDQALLDLFARREEISKIKGDSFSGMDLIEAAIQQMCFGSESSKKAIVGHHADVPAEQLEYVFDAAREVVSPEELYEIFSHYLTAKVDEKKKVKDPAYAKREAIISAITSDYRYVYWYRDSELDLEEKVRPYDPRWLDIAVDLGHKELIRTLACTGNVKAQEWAKNDFETALTKAKKANQLHQEVHTLILLQHPDMVDCFFRAIQNYNNKSDYYMGWYVSLIRKLPKQALPRLEEFVSKLTDKQADGWIEAIEALRNKPE